MSGASAHSGDGTHNLPDTVYLVNDELQQDEIKFHIYVHTTSTGAVYSTQPGSYYKPRCGQDGRKRDTDESLIEVPTTALLNHLLPGICRRCLHHMDLPQPETEVIEGDITIIDGDVYLSDGTVEESTLDASHKYLE